MRTYEQVICENLLRWWFATSEIGACWASKSKYRNLAKRPRDSADSPEKILTCCLRVKQFPQWCRLQRDLYIFRTDPIFLSELWSIHSPRTPSKFALTAFPACTSLREGGWGLVVTALPVNKTRSQMTKKQTNTQKVALRMLSAANKDRRYFVSLGRGVGAGRTREGRGGL